MDKKAMREVIFEETKDADGVFCYIKRGELVRCGECKHYLDTLWIRERCGLKDIPVDKNDYCADGERKDGEE